VELALGGLEALDEAELESVLRVTENKARILATTDSMVFDGDLHFFEAAREDKPDGPYWATWLDHVGGRVVCESVPARHLDMLGQEAVSVLGPLVAAILKEKIVQE